MNIIKSKKEFEDELLKIAKSKPTFFYFCTFGFKLSNFTKDLFNTLPYKCSVKGIIGINDKVSKSQIGFFKSYFKNCRIVHSFHVKMIVTDKVALIGGRNLTDSDWDDITIRITKEKGLYNLKKHFESLYKSKKSL